MIGAILMCQVTSGAFGPPKCKGRRGLRALCWVILEPTFRSCPDLTCEDPNFEQHRGPYASKKGLLCYTELQAAGWRT